MKIPKFFSFFVTKAFLFSLFISTVFIFVGFYILIYSYDVDIDDLGTYIDISFKAIAIIGGHHGH